MNAASEAPFFRESRRVSLPVFIKLKPIFMPAAPAKAAAPAVVADVDGTPINAPMPGMIVSYEKKVGDSISEGETIVVLEAMKMENALPTTVSGTVKAINFKSGDSVAKNDVLCVIG